MKVDGACHCGKITYEAQINPEKVAICHCTDCQTGSGNADIPQAGAYTLNSIAAVVLGGISLLGGVGTVIGALIGALILRAISFYFRILSIDPLLQPLVEGVVLLAAVSLGAIRTLRVKNRLELFR